MIFCITLTHNNLRKSGVKCVSMNWLNKIHENGAIDEENASSLECLVDSTISANSKIIGISIFSGRIPNSASFDGPVLCCALSSGKGILIPLLTLPASLDKLFSGQNNRANSVQIPNIVEKLKALLSKKTTRMLPANGATLPVEVYF
jgi:hypothetical protein